MKVILYHPPPFLGVQNVGFQGVRFLQESWRLIRGF